MHQKAPCLKFLIKLIATTTLFAFFSFVTEAQEATIIRGIVIDKGGDPLPGCNVLIKGTTNGTAADMCGEFSIQVEQPKFTILFADMSYEDLRVFEIVLETKDITSDKIIFQIGTSTKRNKNCGQTKDTKLRTIRIK